MTNEKGTRLMKKKAGLWIDHREAFIVTVTGKREETNRISSNIELDAQFSGNSRSAGAQDVEDVQDRKLVHNLKCYYDAIIEHIQNAESIWIFGPGEAKGELVKRLKSNNLGQHIVSIDTVDKLTDPQIVAKVRHDFPKKQVPKGKNHDQRKEPKKEFQEKAAKKHERKKAG
jgi:hypothetical protein